MSLVWSEVVAQPVRGGLWSSVMAAWLVGAVITRCWWWPPAAEATTNEAEDLFPTALSEYLRGNWIEAEKLIVRILRTRPEDAETRLLWTAVLRRTHRREEARRRLRELSLLDTARQWQWEIKTELEQLERDDRRLEEQSPDDNLMRSAVVEPNTVGDEAA